MDNSKVAKHFDLIASKYDDYKRRNNLYYKTLKNAIKSQIKSKNPRILDIGCGTGEILHFLKPSYGLGVDISKEMVKQAKRKYANVKSLSFLFHDIEREPISGNFDYVLFNDVIEHISNKEKAIKNISKLMKKNTTLILSMANPLWEPLLIILENLHFKMPEGPHKRISEAELFSLLKKYRLSVVSKKIYFPHLNIPIVKNLGLIYLYIIRKKH